MICEKCHNRLAEGQTICDICGFDMTDYIPAPLRRGVVRHHEGGTPQTGTPNEQAPNQAPRRMGIVHTDSSVQANYGYTIPQERKVEPKEAQTGDNKRVKFVLGVIGICVLCAVIFVGGLMCFITIFGT